MQREGLLNRSRGGAFQFPRVGFDRPLAEATLLNTDEKAEIGRLAAALIEPGDTVMMDSGSTTCQVARFLPGSRVTVVSNSLSILGLLYTRPGIEVVALGGMLRRHGGCTVGPMTVDGITSLRADKAILGMDAVSATEGLATPDPLIAEVKKAMIDRARDLIVVADHSKLDSAALCHVAPISRVRTLVTGPRITTEQREAFLAAGVEVLAAGS